MAKLNNIRTVSVPSIGKLPLAADPGSFTPSGAKREHKPGRLPADGGFMETSAAAMLDLNINLASGFDMDSLNAVDGETVTIRLSDGRVYMMPDASVTDPSSFGNGESKVQIVANTSERIA